MASAIIKVGTSGKLKDGRDFKIIDFQRFAIADDGSIHSGVVGVVVNERYGIYAMSTIAENIDYKSIKSDFK